MMIVLFMGGAVTWLLRYLLGPWGDISIAFLAMAFFARSVYIWLDKISRNKVE